MDMGVELVEAGRLGAGSRIDISTEPPTIEAVEYELSGWARDDLMACGPVVLISERLAVRLGGESVRGVEFVPAAMLPVPPDAYDEDEPLPPDAPDRFRWVRVTDASDPDMRVVVPDYLLVSERVAAMLREAVMPNAEIVVPEDPDVDASGPLTGMAPPDMLCAYIHGTHGPHGFDGLPVVEAFCTSDRDEQEGFATVTDAITWGRSRAGRVVVHLADGSWSAGTEPAPGFNPLPADELRRADAQALSHRQQGLDEILVHSEPRPWYMSIIAPETTLPLDEAERRVRAVEGVDDLTRHRTAGGDPLWLIITNANGPDDLHALDSRIGEVLLTPDRYAHLQDGDTFSYSTGHGQESGLLEHLDLEALLAGSIGHRGGPR